MQHRFWHSIVILFILFAMAFSSLGITSVYAATLSFAAPVGYTTSGNTGATHWGVAVADFNGDGKPDLATPNDFTTDVSVLLNSGTGTFPTVVRYTVGLDPKAVAAGDLNGDDKPDLVVANRFSSISVLLNKGDGTFASAVDYSTESASSIRVGDLNGDGKNDLALVTSDKAGVLLNNGNGTFATAVYYSIGIGQKSITSGDFNEDGKLDLATANQGNDSASVLLNNGDGTFATSVHYAAGVDPNDVAVGDFNGDGKPDLATANLQGDNVSVLLNSGAGVFTSAVNYAVGDMPMSIAVGDFNGDGKPDLAAGNMNNSNLSVLLNNGAGTFASAVNYVTAAAPFDVAVGDFNGDGKPDLTTVNNGITDISILFNTSIYDPIAVTSSASALATNGATLNGPVNARGNDNLAVSFDYGPTPAYGTNVAASPSSVSGMSDTPVSAVISGLTPNTTYYFRVNIGSLQGSQQTFTTLGPAPFVSSIIRANPSPTNLASVNYTVTFSEAVTSVDTTGPTFDNFTLATSLLSGASITSVSGSGSTYTVSVNTGTGNGTIGLNLSSVGAIVDADNLPLTGSFSGAVYGVIKVQSFNDVPPTYWASTFINRLFISQISGGCGNGNFCPDMNITREQMAVFVLRAKHGSAYTPPPATGRFSDVPVGSATAPWIEQMAAEGITGGCGNNNFCPTQSITRAQAAVMLLVAKHGAGYTPPAAKGLFKDVPVGNWAAPWVEELVTEGIVSGCGNGNFCPNQLVTRAQMAVFLVTAFNLP
jgi:hypothetical protein